AGGLRKVHGQLQRLDKIDRSGNFNAAAGDGDILPADLVPLPVQKNIVELLVYRGGSAAENQHHLGGEHLVHVFLPAAEGQLRGLRDLPVGHLNLALGLLSRRAHVLWHRFLKELLDGHGDGGAGGPLRGDAAAWDFIRKQQIIGHGKGTRGRNTGQVHLKSDIFPDRKSVV